MKSKEILMRCAGRAIQELREDGVRFGEEDRVAWTVYCEPTDALTKRPLRALILYIIRGESPENILVDFELQPQLNKSAIRMHVDEIKSQIEDYLASDAHRECRDAEAYTIEEWLRKHPNYLQRPKGEKRTRGNALVLTLCSTTGEMHDINENNICTGCGRRVEDPIKGDKNHKSVFSQLELRGRMHSMGYNEVVSLIEPDDEIVVVKPGQHFRCALTSEEVDRILASVSFSGLGMYNLMCEYEPDTRFTLETLTSLASNSREETEAILNALLNAGYVYREDDQEEGMQVYSVNRDMLPNSVSGERSEGEDRES